MQEQPAKFKAPLQVVLMFVIILATILLGFLMMPSSQEEHDDLLQKLGTTNHGMLLDPVKPISELTLTDDDGNPWRWADHKPKWRFLIPSNQRCDGECADLLFITRQVHIRLGKYTHRLERILLTTEGDLSGEFRASLAETHPYLKVLHTDADRVSEWLANTNDPWVPGKGRAILVDPTGVAMMVYDGSQNGNDMLEDLNHLLKYSAD